MSGITFYKTKSLDMMKKFYHDRLKLTFWQKHEFCHIYQSGNLLLGFIKSETADTDGLITFFEKHKESYERKYASMTDIINDNLVTVEEFNIQSFSVRDPENRIVEFQYIKHPLKPFNTIEEALINRRSIRKYKEIDIPESVLNDVFSLCRYSPTSYDSQSFYFVVVKNKEDLNFLAESRGDASRHIATAPLTVLVCADHTRTLRMEQDANIASIYYILSAFSYGLGTCWVTEMNKLDIKERFNIPQNDFISSAIPTGYPDEIKDIPNKRNINDFVKWRN